MDSAGAAGSSAPEGERAVAADPIDIVTTAAWHCLDAFVSTYDRQLRGDARELPFKVLMAAAEGGSDAEKIHQALVAAIEVAIECEFLPALALGVLETRRALGLDEAVTRALIALVGERPRLALQRIQDEARGIGRTPDLFRILDGIRSIALIKANGRPVGTGFLVAPDLLLTAAHVMIECGARPTDQNLGGAEAFDDDEIARRVVIEFWPQHEDAPLAPTRAVRLRSTWRAAWRDPDGRGDGFSGDAARLGSRLDFALLRLAEPIRDDTIKPVAIHEPPDPTIDPNFGPPCFVVGHDGGSASKWDVHPIDVYDQTIGRIRHRLNTLSGQSGCPYFSNSGKVFAIHEAAVRKDRPRPGNGCGRVVALEPGIADDYNRAVALEQIRAALRGPRDPLKARSTADLAIEDGGFRLRWAEAGLNYARGDNSLAQAWRDAVRSIGDGEPDAPDATAKVEAFHPLFERPAIAAWIETAAEPKAVARVCFITGAAGTGKTFALEYATHVLGNSRVPTIHVPSTIVTAPGFDRIVAALHGDGSTSWEARRPIEGELKHDVIPSLLARLETSDGPVRHIAVDFGDGSAWRQVAGFWREFIIQATQRRLRLMLAAVPANAVYDLQGAIESEVIEQVDLVHITWKQVHSHVARLAEAVGDERGIDDLKKLVKRFAAPALSLGARDIRFATLDAVRIALAVRRELAGAGRQP
jgi:hypothetical protein